ncbi:MAG: hypothetical protein BLM47_12100 [Candidatus Reconcilbacillus cellulovorans]|uniref:Chromate transporter n=1 Tax=Candidatus Reconcilbacillus cellulovorans TaxID=1906605 RepID=A0A2A6DXQ3_9BACL|nr:MAG: hypothetical protein BLM47_12100 [Candidatus Reconcilbacillus cellulovorans]
MDAVEGFQLFVLFFTVGAASFGGGYGMLPWIEREVSARGWMTLADLTDVVAIAGIVPGPVAANAAVLVGFRVAGVVGALVAALAMALPSFLFTMALAAAEGRRRAARMLARVYTGVRPVVAALIAAAAVRFAAGNGVVRFRAWDVETYASATIVAAAFWLLAVRKAHPAAVMVLCGWLGWLMYG